MEKCIDIIYDYFKEILQTDTIYCKWLTTKENVMNIYLGHEDCTKYKINDDRLVVSDLDCDGALFISASPFEEIENQI